MHTPIRKALTFRASSIGDALMGKYLLENIHKAYPEARCAILVASKGAMVRDLLANYPWIEIVEANTRSPRSIVTAFKKLYPSDATVTQYSGRGTFSIASKLFARLVTRSGRLAGFTDASSLNRYLFDHVVPFSMRRAMRLHECDALSALGIPVLVPDITIIPKEGSTILETFGLSKKMYIVVNLFSGSKERGLSLEHQRAITYALYAAFGSQKKIILTGGPSDKQLMQSIKETVPDAILAPKLSMQDLITLVADSSAVVSLDTGVAHIAAQTGVPLVVMRTCWGYNWWIKDQYSRGGIIVLAHDECCTSGHISKDFPACLSAITPEEVVQAVGQTLIL